MNSAANEFFSLLNLACPEGTIVEVTESGAIIHFPEGMTDEEADRQMVQLYEAINKVAAESLPQEVKE